MMTMSQVVHGLAPAATGDGGESRGGRHTAPGAEQKGLDQAPNTPAATGDGGESQGGRHTAPGAEQQGLDEAPNTPAATGDGGESRGGRHTAPGAEQQGLDQAPNTGGILDCNATEKNPHHPWGTSRAKALMVSFWPIMRTPSTSVVEGLLMRDVVSVLFVLCYDGSFFLAVLRPGIQLCNTQVASLAWVPILRL